MTNKETESEVLKVRTDPYSNNVLFVLTADQDFITYEYKNIDEHCKVRERFNLKEELE